MNKLYLLVITFLLALYFTDVSANDIKEEKIFNINDAIAIKIRLNTLMKVIYINGSLGVKVIEAENKSADDRSVSMEKIEKLSSVLSGFCQQEREVDPLDELYFQNLKSFLKKTKEIYPNIFDTDDTTTLPTTPASSAPLAPSIPQGVRIK